MKDIKKRLIVVYVLMGLFFAFKAGSYSREAEIENLSSDVQCANDFIEELQDGGK